MLKVNIYIETDIGSRKRLYRGYGAVVEFMKKNGETETRRAFGLCDGTWNLAYIIALTDALELLVKPCTVTIFAADRYVCGSLCNGRAKEWHSNGWRTTRGEPIACAEEWKALVKAASGHELHFAGAGKNPYRSDMQNEIKKIKRRGESWQQMRIMS